VGGARKGGICGKGGVLGEWGQRGGVEVAVGGSGCEGGKGGQWGERGGGEVQGHKRRGVSELLRGGEGGEGGGVGKQPVGDGGVQGCVASAKTNNQPPE